MISKFKMAEDNPRLPNSDPDDVFNDSILRALIKVIDMEELWQWRLVSRTSNLVATLELQRRHGKTKIRNDDEMDSFLSTIRNTNHNNNPFTSYELALGNISLDSIQEFAETIGENRVLSYEFNELIPYHRYWDDDEPFIRDEIQDDFDNYEISTKILLLLQSASVSLEKLFIQAEADINLVQNEQEDFPLEFPRLFFIEVEYLTNYPLIQDHDVVSMAINRAPNLRTLNFRLEEFGRCSSLNAAIPSYLFETSRLNPPSLAYVSEMNAEDIPTIGRLIEMRYNKLRKFYISIDTFGEEETIWNTIIKSLLSLQSECMESLIIQSYIHLQFQLKIPPLRNLTYLYLFFMDNNQNDQEITPFSPFTRNQFPALERLDIGEYNSNHKWFRPWVVFAKLNKLCISDYYGSTDDECFHICFPNLKKVEFFKIPNIPCLTYVLKYLTGIESLDLGNVSGFRDKWFYDQHWEIYTGEASRISETELLQLWNTDSQQSIPPLEEPEPIQILSNHKIYKYPSLANLKNLKELYLWARTPIEIQAIVYMSRPGGLPSLELLSIGYYPFSSRSVSRFGRSFETTDASTSAVTPVAPTVDPTLATAAPSPPDLNKRLHLDTSILPSERTLLSEIDESPSENLEAVADLLEEFEEELDELAEWNDNNADDDFNFGLDDVRDDFDVDYAIDFNVGASSVRIVDEEESGIDPEYINILQNYHKNLKIYKHYYY